MSAIKNKNEHLIWLKYVCDFSIELIVVTEAVIIRYSIVRARKSVHFDFGLQLENHAELNTKTTSVVITRAKGKGYSREKKRGICTKIKEVTDVTQNASQNLT